MPVSGFYDGFILAHFPEIENKSFNSGLLRGSQPVQKNSAMV
jgi:hypothetical protein